MNAISTIRMPISNGRRLFKALLKDTRWGNGDFYDWKQVYVSDCACVWVCVYVYMCFIKNFFFANIVISYL